NIHNLFIYVFFFFQAEDGIRDFHVTGVQTCALPIYSCKKWRDYWPLNPIPRNLNGFSNCARRPARSRESLGASITEFRPDGAVRSEERRVGKECRCRRSPRHRKKKKKNEAEINGIEQ